MIGSALVGTVTLSARCRRECIFSVEPNIEAACYQWRLLSANWLREYRNFGSLQDYLRVGNNPLRRPLEVLVRFSLDVQPVRASRLREIFGPVATPMWNFSTNVGSLRRYCFPFSFTLDSIVDKVIYMDCGYRHCCTSIQRLVGQRSSLQPWAFLCFMSFQLADGANRDRTISAVQTSALDLEEIHLQTTPLRCHGWCQFFVQWSVYLPLGYFRSGGNFATSNCHGGSWLCHTWSAFDRINSENNCLRREVSSLNGALSELFSVVGRLREDLDGITADHDRLAEQVGLQHVGMVRLGFNPYQSLSIQQRQQVFARERRNMMAYRAMGPDGFMSTVLRQDRLLGLQSDFNVVGGLVQGWITQGGGNSRHPTSHWIQWCGDGSSLPQNVLWAIARNKLQIELYNCLVREDFTRARLFQQALLSS